MERGPGAPAVYELGARGLTSLGRNLQNTIVLFDEHASRWHAEIVHKDGRWFIRDLDTRNGTRLDSVPVRGEAPLADGQEIVIGNTWLRFRVDPAGNGVAAPDGLRQPEEVAGGPEFDTAVLQADELTALCRLMAALVEETDPRTLVRRALQTVHSQTGATVAGFLGLDPDDPLPKIVLPELARVDVQLSQYLTQKVQSNGQPVWLKAEGPPPGGESDSLVLFTDAVCVPLRAEGLPLGALHVYKTGQCFTERDLRFCEILAGHLASSLRLLRVRRNLEAENSRLRGRSPDPDEIIGTSAAMQQLRQLITRAAARPSTVLIVGESGAGKELVALALHRQSLRRDGPLVVLNCAAIAPSLIESELFGYCKGAFTGADRDRPGLFQLADEGTLFLDEVGEMPADCQAKLLRVIEGKSFRPVGGSREVQTDVRIIAATHRDLEREVRQGRFREDLYFRLRVIPLAVPPLRERAEDIPVLAHYFLGQLAFDRHPVRLTDTALRRLQQYSWPGNVRQLRSVLECSMALSDKEVLDADDLALPAETSSNQPPTLNLDELETWAIRQALRQTGGNITQAARLLGVVRDTLASKIKKKGLTREDDKS
jgi:Nif-specific regulatory protein